MNNQNQQGKYFTPLNIVDATSKNGTYKFAVIRGRVINPKTRTANTSTGPQTVVSFGLPVNNRAKAINNHLGTNFSLDEETIWVQVSLWGQLAERFLKFSKGADKMTIEVFGSLRTREFVGQDGQKRLSVELTASDFWGLPKNGTQPAESQNGQVTNRQAAPTTATPSVPADFYELAEDEEVPF